MSPSSLLYWMNDWIWGGPLIIVTVVVHVLGLGLIDQKVTRVLERSHEATPLLRDFRRGHEHHHLADHPPARRRGGHLGGRLSVSRVPCPTTNRRCSIPSAP